MIRNFFTVGGLTLVSRVTGFMRDIMLAAVLGAGPMADAFFVALRLPNHFRAIFAEGAFNAAFVPAYARVREQGGADPARLFADRIFTMLFASQIVLLALALAFTPAVIDLLAPGLRGDANRYPLAVDLTRITFPYLLLITIVTLYGGMLNTLHRFAAAAAAPILLNLSMMAALALAAFFPTAGHAAAWGVLIAGILEVLLLLADAGRAGIIARFRWPQIDEDVRKFFRALGPATIGSAGVQLALFADTVIASFLVTGALSALYYADRLNQLPIGVIGIAIGTVLLPDMARKIAAGDETGASHAQNRAFELTLLLSIPCVVAFLIVPDLIMRALFQRGAFTAGDAQAAGDDVVGLRDRSHSLCPDPFCDGDILRARRHGDAGQGVADRGGREYCLQDRAHGSVGAGRPCAGHIDRRLDQSCLGSVVCEARGFAADRCAPQTIADHIGDRRCRARDLPLVFQRSSHALAVIKSSDA